MHANNENEMPVEAASHSRLGKNFRTLNDASHIDKRPRLHKSQAALSATTTSAVGRRAPLGERRAPLGERRAALADVTNRISVKKSSTSHALGSGTALAKKKLLAKRAQTTHLFRDLPPTTPVVNTLHSLGLSDKKPLSASALTRIDEVKSASASARHDIDSADRNDPTQCWQYAEDITAYHLATEKKRQPSNAYMSLQSDINSKMRAILVDWLVDVHYKYALLPQTLHIAVLLIDRFLEKNKSIKRQRLQLVGITALFVASKYEEIYPPEAVDFVKITDNAYTREELFGMERELLAAIKYRVTFPTAYQFMKRFLKASRTTDNRVEHFAHYVIDRSLQEIKLLKYNPSLIAASAVHIARTQMKNLPAWSSTVEYHSTYSELAMRPCMDELKEVLWNGRNGVGKNSKLTAVRRKFSKERFMSVATHELDLNAGN